MPRLPQAFFSAIHIGDLTPTTLGDPGQHQVETNLVSGVSVDPGAAGAGTPGAGTFYDGGELPFLHVRRGGLLIIH